MRKGRNAGNTGYGLGRYSARGMALDLAVESAREGGASSFLLELGGTIYAAGVKTSVAPWRVSIGNESTAKNSAICSIPLSDRALAAVRAAGTGDIREVAVAAPSALAAEVFANVLLSLGPASWKRLLEGLPGFDAVFITVDGYILATSGIYPLLNLESKNHEVLMIYYSCRPFTESARAVDTRCKERGQAGSRA